MRSFILILIVLFSFSHAKSKYSPYGDISAAVLEPVFRSGALPFYSYPSLFKEFLYLPSLIGPNFPLNFNHTLALSHSADSSSDGCTPLVGNYTGSIVLFTSSKCSDLAGKHAEAAQASAYLIPGSWPLISSANFSQYFGIPSAGIFLSDLLVLEAALLNNTNSIYLYFPGTGSIDNLEKSAIYDMALKVSGPEKSFSRSSSEVFSLKEMLSQNLDPCLHRVQGITCVNGSIVSIWWLSSQMKGTISPSISQLLELRSFYVGGNQLGGHFPSVKNCTKLELCFLNANSFTSISPDFAEMQSIITLDLDSNKFGNLPDMHMMINLRYLWIYLNNMTVMPKIPSSVIWVHAGYNSIAGNIENFSNFQHLLALELQFNQLSDSNLKTKFDDIPNLLHLDLSFNEFSGETPILNKANKLKYLRLNNNKFSGFNKLSKLPNLIEIQAQYNQIENQVDLTSLLPMVLPKSLEFIDFSHNKLKGRWDSTTNLLSSGITEIRDLIFSYNNLQSFPFDLFQFLPKILTVDFSYNSLNFTFDGSMVAGAGTSLSYFDISGNPNIVLLNAGTNGLPSYATQSPSMVIFKENSISFFCPTMSLGSDNTTIFKVDPIVHHYSNCRCENGYISTIFPPDCRLIPRKATVQSFSFSPMDYGNNRLSPGLTTSWFIEGKLLHSEEIKAIKLNIQFVEENWVNSTSSSLSIYEGDADASSSLLLKTFKSTIPSSIDVYIFSNLATISFNSAEGYGEFFNASIMLLKECPENYIFYQNEKCIQLLNRGSSIQIVVFVVTALILLLIFATTIIIYKKRQSLIIKSSSAPFCFAMLFFLTVLCFSSIFYAIHPENGQWVCHIRPWLSYSSIVGLLSALILKADRIRKIFTSKDLVVQSISNATLAKFLMIFLGLEFIFLIVFSSMGLGETGWEISKDSSQGLFSACYNSTLSNSQFTTWFVVQLIYICVFLLASIFEAWGIRKVPTAFNEGPHIASCIMSLFVILVLVVPINFFIDSNPDGLILIRGIGQNLLSLIMVFFLFGPKVFYIIEGRENDKQLSSVGSKSSSTSSTSSSSSQSSSQKS